MINLFVNLNQCVNKEMTSIKIDEFQDRIYLDKNRDLFERIKIFLSY